MKNDLSFLVSGTLSLYEHQSTYTYNRTCPCGDFCIWQGCTKSTW